MATQNPIEMEGTYPLPEAQVDRFLFKLIVDYPTRNELMEILDRTTRRETPSVQPVMKGEEVLEWRAFVREVVSAPRVTEYAVRLVLATQPAGGDGTELVRKYVRFGSSPRGAQALLLAGKVAALREGRYNVSFADIRGAALSALRHRVLLNFEADADGVTADAVVEDLVGRVEEAAKVA
jgi:MoxR-like ATPase